MTHTFMFMHVISLLFHMNRAHVYYVLATFTEIISSTIVVFYKTIQALYFLSYITL